MLRILRRLCKAKECGHKKIIFKLYVLSIGLST